MTTGRSPFTCDACGGALELYCDSDACQRQRIVPAEVATLRAELASTEAERSRVVGMWSDAKEAARIATSDITALRGDLATLRRERDEAREALRSEHHTLTKLRLKENFDAVESIEASQSWHAAEDPLRALPVPAAPKAPTERPIGGQGNANDA